MANVFQNKDTIFKYHRNKDGTVVPPKIFLCTRTLKKIGLIHPVYDLKVETKFNEANTCSFTIYKNNNGIEMPNFQRVKNLSVIQIEGFGLFEIQVTVTEDDAVYKRITGTALQESELSQTYCTLEINTENDFNITGTDSNENYPTLFYRDLSTSSSENEQEKRAGSSLLHRILSYAPTYTIGHVDNSLMGINREFSCSNSTVYDFLQEVAEEVGCIFIFDPMSRKINAYDLEDHCLNCGGRHIIHGVCQNCQDDGVIEHGYGLDTTIYVDTHTIAESIEDSVDVDSVKNCFKLVAGDDETTNRIGQRLIGGSNYIWTFGEEQLAEFSDPLRDKWLEYPNHVNKFQAEFNQCWDEYNKKVNDILYLQSGKMPTTELNSDDSKPAEKCEEIYKTIKEKIQYYVIGTMNAVPSSVAGNILKFANFLCPPGYKVEFQTDKYGNKRFNCETKEIDHINVITKFKCYLYIYLMDCKDENQKDKYYYQSDKEWKIDVKPGYNKMNDSTTFSHDYYLYLKQMMDYKMASLDITFDPKYDTDYTDGKDHTGEKDYYEIYFKEYSINRLISFRDAYDTCIAILLELDTDLATNKVQQGYNYVLENGTPSSQTMYGKLTEKYTAFSECISRIISDYTDNVKKMEGEVKGLLDRISGINQECNIKTYLGEELYQELISFKREQVYENQNFTSNVADESTLMDNVEEFILRAKEEIAKSCQFQHSVPISMSNLLTLADFEQVFDVFALGNYIRTRINGELVKFRIISIPFDFEHIEQCEFTFSDALVGNQALKDFQKKTQKAQSLATSFDYVQRQSTANDEKISSFTEMFREGLDATKTLIMSADDVSTVMDGHGILTRRLNLDTGDYYPEQLRITNGTIGYTDDDWETIKAAFGRFYWNGAYRYGLIGECIVGEILAGEQLIIRNKDKSVQITGDGIEISKGTISWDNVDAPEIEDIKQLSESLNNLNENIEQTAKASNLAVSNLDKKVAQYLTAGSSTTIGEKYVISPYIGGGYLNISDIKHSTEKRVIIDPNNYTGRNCIFQVYDEAGDMTIGVTSDGHATFKGTIYATDGEFTGKINGAKISGGKIDGAIITSTHSVSGSINETNNSSLSINGGNMTFHSRYDDIDNVSSISDLYMGSIDMQCEITYYTDNDTARNYRLNQTHLTSKGMQIKTTDETSDATSITYTQINPYNVYIRENSTVCIQISTSAITTKEGYNINCSGGTIKCSDIILTSKETRSIYTISAQGRLDLVATSVHSSGTFYTPDGPISVSDQRLKTDIADVDDSAVNLILSLQPKKYKLKNGTSGRYHYGLVAQEVEHTMLDTIGDAGILVKSDRLDAEEDSCSLVDLHDENTYYYGLRYEELIAPMIKTIQKLNTEIQKLKKELKH